MEQTVDETKKIGSSTVYAISEYKNTRSRKTDLKNSTKDIKRTRP